MENLTEEIDPLLQEKKSLKFYIGKIDVWEDWRLRYKTYVPQFIEACSKELDLAEWDEDLFTEFFEKSNNQCVSSLKQGYFTKNEKSLIRSNWGEIKRSLKRISSNQEKPSYEDYEELKDIIRKFTDQDRKAATNRLSASIQPHALCTIVNHSDLKALIAYLNKYVENADFGPMTNWFRSSNEVLEFFLTESGIADPYELITYPWQVLDLFRSSDNDNSITNIKAETMQHPKTYNLLKYKKQIILQGPPGTGKTRKAKQIARNFITLTEERIKEKIQTGLQILTVKGEVTYTVKSNESNKIVLEREKGTINTITYSKILNSFKQERWNNEVDNNEDRMAVAIAKYLLMTY